jgi:hypothetical protein
MGAIVLRVFPASNIVCLFDEPNTSGDPEDIDAPRNAPAKTPLDYLNRVFIHSALDYMEVLSDTNTSVSHAAVAATTDGDFSTSGSQGGANNRTNRSIRYNRNRVSHTLATHNQGTLVDCAVIVDGSQVVFPGMPIQVQSVGRARYCSVYVNNTQVRLHEWSSAGSSDLAALSKTYRTIVFRRQRAPVAGKPVYGYDPATGHMVMARGMISSEYRYLQVVSGGTPWGIAYGRQMDLRNGAPRWVNPDGTIREPVPSDLRMRFEVEFLEGEFFRTANFGYSPYWGYDGSFSGPPTLLVQAP